MNISLNDDQLLFQQEHAYIIYKEFNNECYIDYLFVSPEYREEGLGSKIMKEFIKSFSDKGFNKFYLEAYFNSETNKGSTLSLDSLVNFYLSLGFDFDEHQLDDRVLMTLEIE